MVNDTTLTLCDKLEDGDGEHGSISWDDVIPDLLKKSMIEAESWMLDAYKDSKQTHFGEPHRWGKSENER